MATGENWTKEETIKNVRKEAQRVLDNIKKENKGKRFILKPHPTIPKTIIEEKVKD